MLYSCCQHLIPKHFHYSRKKPSPLHLMKTSRAIPMTPPPALAPAPTGPPPVSMDSPAPLMSSHAMESHSL